MIDNSSSTRERRDKKLLIFIIPIGVILMLVSGQIAARLTPQWMVNAGMQSNLDPDRIPHQQNSPIQPILPAILTPMSWFETFLTPGAGGTDEPVVFIPFVVIEPSATPNVTPVPPTVATQPSATAPTSPPPSVTSSPPPATGTSKPPDDEEPTPTAPTPTAPTPAPTATGTPSMPVGYVEVLPDGDIQVNQPPDGAPGHIGGGGLPQYIVIDLGINPANQVVVSSTPDGNYDLIFYEYVFSSGHIMLDDIIIGISKNPDGSYYEVFEWGDDDRDQNTNVDYTKLPVDPACASGLECDNRDIPTTVLYGTPPYQSGILIDVDYNTDGKPPEGSYQYLVILAPPSSDASQVDAVVVAEVPGGKFGVTSVRASEGESQAAEEAVAPATVDQPQSPDPPADEGAASESEPSAEEVSEEQNQPPEPEEQDQSLEPPAEQPPAPP